MLFQVHFYIIASSTQRPLDVFTVVTTCVLYNFIAYWVGI